MDIFVPKEMAKNTFTKYWKLAIADGRIKPKRVGTAVRYVPSESMKKSRKIQCVPLEFRKEHTKRLKEEVIKPWLEQLPDVYTYGAYFSEPKHEFRGNHKLSVESTLLFDDFKKHICPKYGRNPFKLLASFKEEVRKHWYVINELERGISTILSWADYSRTRPGTLSWKGNPWVKVDLSSVDAADLEELCKLYRRSEHGTKEMYLSDISTPAGK